MIEVVTLQQYADLDRTEINWLVHGLLPKPGFAVLIGKPKSGKSFLALQLALAVAKGQEFMGHQCEQGRVLYLQFDTSEAVWRDRLQTLRNQGVDLTGDVYMIRPDYQPTWANLLTLDTQRALVESIAAASPDLIVIDVLRELHSADEDSSTEMKVVGDILRRITAGRSVFLLHHTHKMKADEDRDPVQCHRGSSYITGMADTVWLLDGRRLYLRPRFDQAHDWEVRQGESGFFTFPQAKEYSDSTRKVLALIQEFPTLPHTKLALLAEQRWGMSRSSFYDHLRKGRTPEGTLVASCTPVPVAAAPARPLSPILPPPPPVSIPPVPPTVRFVVPGPITLSV